MIYSVVISKEISKTVSIEADSMSDAKKEAKKMYDNEEIILDDKGSVNVAITVKYP